MWDYLPCGFSGMGPFRVGHDRRVGFLFLKWLVRSQTCVTDYRLASRTGLIGDTSFEVCSRSF